MTMIRRQVFITKEQSRQLKARAHAAGISEAELIRLGIDRELAASENADAWKRRLLSLAGSLKDSSYLEATIKENRAKWQTRVNETRKKLAGEE